MTLVPQIFDRALARRRRARAAVRFGDFDFLVTRAANGSLVVAVWNLVPPDQTGAAKTVTLRFKNLKGVNHASISRVDRDHGDPHPAYEKMGSPVYPTQAQLQKLRDSAAIGAPQIEDLKNGELSVTLPADGLAVIGIR